MKTIDELIKENDGSRFQQQMADLIIDKKLKVIVETGFGVSSLYITKALETNGEGMLYSIDPNAWAQFRFTHPQFELIEKKSVDSLLEIYLKAGQFDLASLDGNHDIKCQTYEYDFVYACLKPGGYIIADDTFWGGNPAWGKFLESNKLQDSIFGSARIIQKPIDSERIIENAHILHVLCLDHAILAEKNWLAAGNENTPCFAE